MLPVAVIQTGSVLFDTAQTLQQASRLIEEAAAHGAQLIVFPEAYLGGYPKGFDFGAKVGSRTPEGRVDFARYFESAIEVPGPECATLAQLALQYQVHLVVGVIERSGSTLYCCVLFFSPNGALLGKHRKVMPTAAERLIWGFGDGSTLPVFDTTIGRLGAVICWENYMPLLRTAMYAKGIQLYCAPTVDDRDTWLPSMRHIACEGRCFVLSACQFVPVGAGLANNATIQGGSCIIDPFGTVLAGPNRSSQTILYAELDLSTIPKGKYDLDVVGHYARPDIFQLTVNESATKPVDFE